VVWTLDVGHRVQLKSYENGMGKIIELRDCDGVENVRLLSGVVYMTKRRKPRERTEP